MTICLSLKRKNVVAARRDAGQRRDWRGIVSACERERIVGRREKKATRRGREGGEGEGETGKAYQTGFQITEVIPSVIDSPIATYRISVGSGSWEGNYKREEREIE